MLKRIFIVVTFLCISVLLMSWGWQGHEKISNNTSLSFFEQMSQFVSWPTYLADHASDADDRKATDPTESPKHYIDIDNYAEFNLHHRIPQTWDSIIAENGSIWVNQMGILPWATLATYDSLKNAFIHYNWSKAMFFAADIGHYVADGHMPLHITKNYNGENTGNDDIHSRFESTMISLFNSQITYTGDTVKIIPNINQYVFDYLYQNYTYIDSIMIFDDYATAAASGNTYSTTYKNALWSKSKNLTILLFKNASHAIAELIYNAWVEAGSPPVGSIGINENNTDKNASLEQNSPNPFSISTKISYTLNENSENINLSIFDYKGSRISVLCEGARDAGKYNIDWVPQNLLSGIYFLVLRNGAVTEYKKMIFIR